jgi:hypothetical protein
MLSRIPWKIVLVGKSTRVICHRHRPRQQRQQCFSSSSRTAGNIASDLATILQKVKNGQLSLSQAEAILRNDGVTVTANDESSPEETILKSFANIDHSRSQRTGFPEAVFGAGKTADQIARILDDMARNFNETTVSKKTVMDFPLSHQRAILATR